MVDDQWTSRRRQGFTWNQTDVAFARRTGKSHCPVHFARPHGVTVRRPTCSICNDRGTPKKGGGGARRGRATPSRTRLNTQPSKLEFSTSWVLSFAIKTERNSGNLTWVNLKPQALRIATARNLTKPRLTYCCYTLYAINRAELGTRQSNLA